MHFNPSFALLATALIAGRVVALPPGAFEPFNSNITVPDSSQVDGHIYICTDWEFAGECTNFGIINGHCANFPSAFQNAISSVGPDPGLICILYFDTGCINSDGQYVAEYPGFAKLDYGNDAFNSVMCFKTGC